MIAIPDPRCCRCGRTSTDEADRLAIEVVPGGWVPVWKDANVPSNISSSTFGAEDVVIVARRKDLHFWEENGGVPRRFTFEEPLGGDLQIKLVLAGDSAFSADHHPEGVA
jgi:hypothetical protein